MTQTFGREFQHVEDLVYLESQSSPKAITSLVLIEGGTLSYKWDGNPTIYWGRNVVDEFVMVNKNAWGREMCTSPAMLKSFIMSTGKGEPWREEFADSLVEIWDIMEQNTPLGQSYLYGDILFYPRNPARIENNKIVFKPNKVEYRIDCDSPLGQKIKDVKVCVAISKIYSSFGNKTGVFSKASKYSKDFAALPPVEIDCSFNNINLDHDHILDLVKFHSEKHKEIAEFLEPRTGLSDLPNIIYTYVNHKSKTGTLDTLGDDFIEWLPYSKVSTQKQGKILALAKSKPNTLPSIFYLVKEIMKVKNQIIDYYDRNGAIEAYTNGVPGGEGYVLSRRKLKLVPRHRWKPD